MSERGMGSAVGQVPEYTCRIVEWAKEAAQRPVIVKLTPNVTDVRYPARAAKKGGADAVSLINTINSITGVDLDTFTPRPDVGGRSSHGGYCGPAVKPIALNMVAEVAKDPDVQLPVSGIGGVASWRDAVEFLLLGAQTVQVCTAVMHYGFRIIEDLCDGLDAYLDGKGMRSVRELTGRALPSVARWEELDLNHKIMAHVDAKKCIGCGLCYVACNDGAHQAIAAEPMHGRTRVTILEDHCVGCNLCSLVCPVEGCITMRRVETGRPPMSWKDHQRQVASDRERTERA
jgi:dihydropyrimidine dehydrogenase (NAD+) subunit PreA